MTEGLCVLQRAQPWLGTLVSIRVSAPCEVSPDLLNTLIDLAFADVARVHALMSYHDAGSMLSHINRLAPTQAVQADPDTHAVLRAALDFATVSDGAFDPTVAGMLEDWGYLPRRGAAGTPCAGWRDVEVSSRGLVRFHRPLRLDLGGIAKGFAVDRASERLSDAAIDSFVVNAGGDLRVGGRQSHHVSLRDPRSPNSVARRLALQRGALATSGSYFSRIQLADREVSQLVDARRAQPFVRHDTSVTVLAARCIDADALTKVVLFAPSETAEHVLSTYGAQAIVLQPQVVA